MATNLEMAQQFIAAVSGGNVQGALELLTDDVQMSNPMTGTATGKDAVRNGLQQAASYGITWSEPAESGDTISSSASTPMGTVRMIFSFSEDKISSMNIQM